MAAIAYSLVVSALFMLSISYSVNSLSLNYYDDTCPHLEYIVSSAVKKALSNDKTVPAALLRMHFHDCFIRVIINCSLFLLLFFQCHTQYIYICILYVLMVNW